MPPTFCCTCRIWQSVGKNSSADRGKNPGENGNRTDFRECCRQKNNAGSHHVDGGDCGELYHSHFSAFRQCSSLLSRTNFRHIFGTGEDICPESHRNARFSGIGNLHLLSLWWKKQGNKENRSLREVLRSSAALSCRARNIFAERNISQIDRKYNRKFQKIYFFILEDFWGPLRSRKKNEEKRKKWNAIGYWYGLEWYIMIHSDFRGL